MGHARAVRALVEMGANVMTKNVRGRVWAGAGEGREKRGAGGMYSVEEAGAMRATCPNRANVP